MDVIENKICKCCNEIKPRIFTGRNKYKSGVYKSPDGRLWHGRVCPDCYNKLEKSKRLKVIKDSVIKSCEFCSKEFETSNHKRKYCSDSCKVQKSRTSKLPD